MKLSLQTFEKGKFSRPVSGPSITIVSTIAIFTSSNETVQVSVGEDNWGTGIGELRLTSTAGVGTGI